MRWEGRLAGEGGQGLVAGGVNRDRELEAGDLEDAADLVVLAADDEGAAVLTAVEALPGADDEGDPGGVDELAAGEVHQQRPLAAVQSLVERALQLGSGAEVELPANRNRSNAAFELSNLYLEGGGIHGSMLPQDDHLAACCFAPLPQG